MRARGASSQAGIVYVPDMFSRDDLLDALRLRYDVYSADAVLTMARQKAALDDKAAYDSKEVAALRAALAVVGDRVERVLAEIDSWLAVPQTAATPAVAPSAPATAVETTIVLTGAKLGKDEEVLVCGASDLLGDWDPTRARPMARKGDEWMATLTVPPGAELPFKFVRRTKDGDVVWEKGDDRTLVAKPRIEVSWR